MPRLEVLVEEPSAEAALRHLLPKLVPITVRWKIVTLAASFATSGANWKAEAPVPITTTFLPARSCPCSHSVQWNAMPR